MADEQQSLLKQIGTDAYSYAGDRDIYDSSIYQSINQATMMRLHNPALNDELGDVEPLQPDVDINKELKLTGFGKLFWSRLWRLVRVGNKTRRDGSKFDGCPSRFTTFAFLSLFFTATVSISLIAAPTILGRLLCTITCTCQDSNSTYTYFEPSDPEQVQPDANKILEILAFVCGYVLFLTICESIGEWLAWNVGISWRNKLTRRIQSSYFREKLYYKVSNLDKTIENVDQRITADISSFTNSICGSVNPRVKGLIFGDDGVVSIAIRMILFTTVSIYKEGWIGFAIPYGWWLLGMGINFAFMQRIPALTFKKEECEGDFRFSHVRIRTYAESIAFYEGEANEKSIVDKNLSELIKTQRGLANRTFPVLFNSVFQGNFAVMFSYIVPAIMVMSVNYCKFTPETFVPIQQIIGQLMTALSVIPSLGPQFAAMAGLVARLGQLLEILDEFEEEAILERQRSNVEYGDTIKLDNVDVVTPEGNVLIRGLSFEMVAGESVVIMGPSGCGKSSILRVIGGLWPVTTGKMIKPELIGLGGIYFVPQRPYIVQGNLRSQIIYPHTDSDLDDIELVDILKLVHLDYLLERNIDGLDHVCNWEDMLSGGEQQRLGLSRLFYHKPLFAIMDESTSALDVELEQALLQECKDTGITMISVAHRPTVIPYHEIMIKLDGTGDYVISRNEEI
eukprot:TRINITY_DN12130_c0_g1_i1.p1 TRINITY_DN12130_c0_g1~~TRINITY_DN12130_c0_g1_i1.p1  ORF type:complete len:679 (-),score=134.03 TRINITY_DN12130_c0_g1_i1:73-2109(-)